MNDATHLDTASDALDTQVSDPDAAIDTPSTHLETLRARLELGQSMDPDSYWRDQALCATSGVDMYPEPGDSRGTLLAQAWCNQCPVVAQCLASIMKTEDSTPGKTRFGITGGATPNDRWRLHLELTGLRPKERTAGGKPMAPCGTRAAWERHRRHKEAMDPLCAEWKAAQTEALVAATTPSAECGTVDGYLRHRRLRQKVCDPCRGAFQLAEGDDPARVAVAALNRR